MGPVRLRGLGLISSYGTGVLPASEGMRAGRPGITPLTLFDLPFPDPIPVNQIDHSGFPDGEDSAIALLEHVARQAVDDARMTVDSLRGAALIVGSSGFLFAGEAEYRLRHQHAGTTSSPVLRAPGYFPQMLSERLALDGPVVTLSTACSSSANALLLAADLIRRGEVAHALVMGAEGLSRIALTGFHSLMLLDPEGCRPFDRERRGMQLGEAIGAVLLDRGDPADAGTSTGELLGGANLCDIHHVTSATPDGSAMHEVMQQALADARVRPDEIVLIKSHGTGSSDNDAAESAAMRRLWGQELPPFTAIKRYVGHTLGACGVVELVAMLGCLRAGFVPPAAGFAAPDPELLVTPLRKSIPAPRGPVMYNYFGFGGNYASLVVRHGG